MDSDEPRQELELVVANDATSSSTPLAGSLPEFPDISWDDFERASALARADANPVSTLRGPR